MDDDRTTRSLSRLEAALTEFAVLSVPSFEFAQSIRHSIRHRIEDAQMGLADVLWTVHTMNPGIMKDSIETRIQEASERIRSISDDLRQLRSTQEEIRSGGTIVTSLKTVWDNACRSVETRINRDLRTEFVGTDLFAEVRAGAFHAMFVNLLNLSLESTRRLSKRINVVLEASPATQNWFRLRYRDNIAEEGSDRWVSIKAIIDGNSNSLNESWDRQMTDNLSLFRLGMVELIIKAHGGSIRLIEVKAGLELLLDAPGLVSAEAQR